MKFVSTLLEQHLQRYPQMELADIYKLLHQAATGAAHAAPKFSGSAAHAAPKFSGSAAHAAPKFSDSAAHAAPKFSDSAAHAAPGLDVSAVRASIERELRAMGNGPTEPVIDPISPDGQLARVHLRAYAAAGHDIEALARAFVETAERRPPDRDKLERFCGCLGEFAETGKIAFDASRVRAYFAQVVEGSYPAVRHSEVFRAAYRPAYRVVQIDLLRGI
jgi:hypothetical protein